MVEHTEQRAIQDEDEISLVDIIRFFSRNLKFLALTTLGLSAIAITLFLLQPKQYQKQLTLSVKPGSITLSTPLNLLTSSRLLVDLDVNQVSNLAVTLLQNQPSNQIASTAKYNTANQQIDLTLQSPDPNLLRLADSKILNQLTTGFQKPLDRIVAANLIRVDLELNRSKQILAQMEKQIAQTPKGIPATAPNPRLLALEEQRSRYVDSITSLEFDKQYLVQARKNPAQFASQVISVQILTESKVRPARSPMKVVVLAAIASFILAVLAALIRDQVEGLQDEMSKQKIDRRKKKIDNRKNF